MLSEPDDNKLVYALHDGRRLQMFEKDIRERGTPVLNEMSLGIQMRHFATVLRARARQNAVFCEFVESKCVAIPMRKNQRKTNT